MRALETEKGFDRFAGLCAIAAAIASVGNLVLTGAATRFELSRNPYHGIEAVADLQGAGALLRWSLIADFLGYYLLLVPLALVLYERVAARAPRAARLYTLAGVASLLFGAAGAAVLACSWPALIELHRSGDGAQRALAGELYAAVTRAVYGGIWNLLVTFTHATWLLGSGLWLREAQPALGSFTLGVGAVTLAAAVLQMVAPGNLQERVLFGYLFLTPVWSFSWGVALLRPPPASVKGV